MAQMGQANRLVLVAITGQMLSYGLAIIVARSLSITDFEAYVIASALFVLLAALALFRLLVPGVALAVLGQAGVIALELAGAPIGPYAATMASASLAAVLATATNRALACSLALMIDRDKAAAAARLIRARLVWLAPPIAGFLILMLGFPHLVLGLFRPEFIADGTTPLRLLAVSTANSVLLSLSPTWLKFRRLHGKLYGITAAAAGMQLLLLFLLVPPWGANGAALAQFGSTLLLYGSSAVVAKRDRSRLNSI
jgi:O-antigen/teichoic acid export membrane protein